MPSIWPTTEFATKLIQEASTDVSVHLGAKYFPLNTVDYKYTGQGIAYKRTKATRGATRAHSLGGTVKRIPRTGLDRMLLRPQYWKERDVIDEEDILTLQDIKDDRELLSQTGRLVGMRTSQLNTRLDTRLEIDRWMAARNGYKDGVTIDGKYIKVDYGIAAPTNAFADWSSLSTAKPLDDIMDAIERLMGTGAKWADVVIPYEVAKFLIRNAQILDLIGNTNFVGQIGIGNIGTLIKMLTVGEGAVAGMPMIRDVTVYGGSYVDETTEDVTPFLDPDIVHVIGGNSEAMPGAPVNQLEMLGEWASVSHVGKSGLQGNVVALETGKFLKVFDDTEEEEEVRLTAGIYGAPVVYHYEWIQNVKANNT